MGYETVRRHLDPLRDYFEAKGKWRLSESYIGSKPGDPSFIISSNIEFVGAYLRDEILIAMFRFDSSDLDPLYIDLACDAIRKRLKKIITTTFPELTTESIGINVSEISGEKEIFDLDNVGYGP